MSEQPKPNEEAAVPLMVLNVASTYGVISCEELNRTLDEALYRILDVPFTFSRWCISGLVPTYAPRCECWRCRDNRGEPRDEALAEAVARKAKQGWDLARKAR